MVRLSITGCQFNTKNAIVLIPINDLYSSSIEIILFVYFCSKTMLNEVYLRNIIKIKECWIFGGCCGVQRIY